MSSVEGSVDFTTTLFLKIILPTQFQSFDDISLQSLAEMMALDASPSLSTTVFLSRQHRNMSASPKRLSLAKVITWLSLSTLL
jgi:hypothetical protein